MSPSGNIPSWRPQSQRRTRTRDVPRLLFAATQTQALDTGLTSTNTGANTSPQQFLNRRKAPSRCESAQTSTKRLLLLCRGWGRAESREEERWQPPRFSRHTNYAAGGRFRNLGSRV